MLQDCCHFKDAGRVPWLWVFGSPWLAADPMLQGRRGRCKALGGTELASAQGKEIVTTESRSCCRCTWEGDLFGRSNDDEFEVTRDPFLEVLWSQLLHPGS